MTWSSFAPVLLWSAVATAAWAVLAFVPARPLGRNNIVDTLWSPGFGLIAVVAFLATTGAPGVDGPRRVLLLVCTLVWALRLGYFVGRRSAGKGDDQRYVDLLDKRPGNRTLIAVAFVFLPQALTLFVVSLTLQVGMAETGPLGVLGWLGVVIWLFGLGFEAVGDHQMNTFRNEPGNRGKLIDRGLWRWTRHPNYFGDATVWTGLFVITAACWPGVVTVVSPALMTYLLVGGTGKRLLERSMSKRPGYAEYAARTSGFFPLPPRG